VTTDTTQCEKVKIVSKLLASVPVGKSMTPANSEKVDLFYSGVQLVLARQFNNYWGEEAKLLSQSDVIEKKPFERSIWNSVTIMNSANLTLITTKTQKAYLFPHSSVAGFDDTVDIKAMRITTMSTKAPLDFIVEQRVGLEGLQKSAVMLGVIGKNKVIIPMKDVFPTQEDQTQLEHEIKAASGVIVVGNKRRGEIQESKKAKVRRKK